jgi:hypothetical protein
MTDYKNEYQKYADDAVRGRAKEDAYGRLRFNLFIAAAGPLAIIALHLLKFEPNKIIAMGIIGTAPLAVVLLIINFIRVPNELKATPFVLLVSLATLVASGATLAMAKVSELTKYVSS